MHIPYSSDCHWIILLTNIRSDIRDENPFIGFSPLKPLRRDLIHSGVNTYNEIKNR